MDQLVCLQTRFLSTSASFQLLFPGGIKIQLSRSGREIILRDGERAGGSLGEAYGTLGWITQRAAIVKGAGREEVLAGPGGGGARPATTLRPPPAPTTPLESCPYFSSTSPKTSPFYFKNNSR